MVSGESNTAESGSGDSSEGSSGSSVAAAPSADARALIARLGADSSREAAVRELTDRYRQAAKHGTGKPEAKAFIDDFAAALAQAYVDGHAQLDEKLRIELITQLVSFKDRRTLPAHQKALQVYAATRAGADEAIWACQAAQHLGDERLAAALLAAFENIDRLDSAGRRLGNHLARAMLAHPHESWAPRLEAMLAAPLERPASFDDKPGVTKFQNQQYWQLTAAKLLGPIGGKSSARVLALAMLDPAKLDVHPSAEVSMAELERHTTPLAHALLAGTDAELVDAAKKARPDLPEAPVFVATTWLTQFGTPSSAAELEAAWDASKSPLGKVMIARALTHYPKTARSLDIFKQTFAAGSAELTLPGGASALEALVVESPYWFEPKLADWLAEQPGKVRGKGRRKGDLQQVIVTVLGQMVTEAQIPAADAVSQRYGGRSGTPAFDASKALVKECKADAACYARAFAQRAGSTGAEAALAIKAAIMVGVYGAEAERSVVLSKLTVLRDPALIAATARVLSQLTPPRDSTVVAEALGKAVAERRAAADVNTDPDDRTGLPIALLWYRLRA